MRMVTDLGDLRASLAALRAGGASIALVPTMGALHEGHLTLVREARQHAEQVVVSIFVNPRQFGPGEDLASYPRAEERDGELLKSEGVALLWLPDVETMYPGGHATTVSVGGLDGILCGAARPGHFDGVATIVAKLFNQVLPDVALFGEKDWQQLAIIRRMAADLDFGLRIEGVATVRDADGLALSSRNAYLSPEQRAAAGMLPRALCGAAAAIRRGEPVGAALERARAQLLAAGFVNIDYLDLRDGDTLAALGTAAPGARLFVAARIGTTRLIDNVALDSALTFC